MTSIEKETIILFNEHEPTAKIETFNGRLLRSLRKLTGRDDVICEIDTNGYGVYTLPKTLIKIHAPAPKKELTESEREQCRKRMEAINATRRKN